MKNRTPNQPRRSQPEGGGQRALRTRAILLSTATLIAVGAYLYLDRDEVSPPPVVQKTGETTEEGLITVRKTVDYEAILKSVLAEEASFLTLTVKRDVIRDKHISTSIKYTPFPASQARVRVKYHVEYPIGYNLRPGQFTVSRGPGGLTVTLPRPSLIARPSVNIQSYDVLESGILIKEKSALLELQKQLQPEAEKRAAVILRGPTVIPRSEKALRAFLQTAMRREADGGKLPAITFRYR